MARAVVANRPWLDPKAETQVVIGNPDKSFGAFTAVDQVNLRIYLQR